LDLVLLHPPTPTLSCRIHPVPGSTILSRAIFTSSRSGVTALALHHWRRANCSSLRATRTQRQACTPQGGQITDYCRGSGLSRWAGDVFAFQTNEIPR
jgi:hypothetical protein